MERTAILTIFGDEAIQFRLAALQDCRMVWEWANDPSIRQNSFSTDPISWETHVPWFTQAINNPEGLFVIVITDDQPIGQVRFKTENIQGVISVSLAQAKRGFGLGSKVIDMASRYLAHSRNIHLIHAYIKPDNIASIHAFKKAGYRFYQETEVNHNPALEYILSLEQTQ